MLNPELAQERLNQVRVKDWRQQKLAQILALPKPLQRAGLAGLCWLPSWPDKLDFQDEPGAPGPEELQVIEAWTAEQRLQLFAIFFPKFAPVVESAWQLLIQMPYQAHYQRRPFRAPANPEISLPKRVGWLGELINAVNGFDQELPWFAAWAAYLGYYTQSFGTLFAAAINQADALGSEILEIMLASARGEHEIGAMGRHVCQALLSAEQPAGWQLMENMLLAAQRQEGLRQTILETVDEAHPQAFRRILKLILDEKLTRFSATIRAFDVWLGFGLGVIAEKQIRQMIEQILAYLENPDQMQAAFSGDEAEIVYLALWTAAYTNASTAIPLAAGLLTHPQVGHRFVATHFLAQIDLNEARLALLPAITDPDLGIAARAMQAFAYGDPTIAQSDAFERLETVWGNFPAKPTTTSRVWDWLSLDLSQNLVAVTLIAVLGERSPQRLIPYMGVLEPYRRAQVAQLLAARTAPGDPAVQAIFLKLVGDPSQEVQNQAIHILQNANVNPSELQQLEQLLTRQSSGLRRGILGLFLKQADTLSIAQRLLVAKAALQRQAGLELLREMVLQNREVAACQAAASHFQTQRSKLSQTETQLLDSILNNQTEASLLDALGLAPQRTPATVPVACLVAPSTDAAIACLAALDELIEQHRQTPVKVPTWRGEEESLFGNLTWQMPSYDPQLSRDENLPHFLLADVWENWWQERPTNLRDADGLELVRALSPAVLQETENPHIRYSELLRVILTWLLYLHPPTATAPEFVLDVISDLFSQISEQEWQQATLKFWTGEPQPPKIQRAEAWISDPILLPFDFCAPTLVSRYWHLLRWFAENYRTPYSRIDLWIVVAAHEAGAATTADLIFYLIGALPPFTHPDLQMASQDSLEAKTNLRQDFHDLASLTSRKPPPHVAHHPTLLALADQIRQRVLEVELQRGDLPTAASPVALALRSVVGIPIVIRILQALDTAKLVRGYLYSNFSKPAVLSHLMRVSFPAPTETPAEFVQHVKAAQISTERLIQLALFAPQWTNYVEPALGWEGFSEAVWWMHAHTKDSGWFIDQDVQAIWTAQIGERTPLDAMELLQGAVDVAWFQRTYQTLGDERWRQIYLAAQYTSSGAGHQRAKQFADAMLGHLTVDELLTRIKDKRHQDSVRALGLIPLETGKKRSTDLLNRYQVMQEFLRTCKQFGAQRQESEKSAVAIGLANLARMAGFIDPQRLQWAMELQAIADLAKGPISVTQAEVTLTLAVNPLGDPELTITKQAKPLKSIPAALKKHPDILNLTTRKQELLKQASRMRQSLEQAMCRGDWFTNDELQQLTQHPILSPMLSQLVWLSEASDNAKTVVLGYLNPQATGLISHDASPITFLSERLRIAHPCDLLTTAAWHLWQQNCFQQARTQPFKQVFRELYVPTTAEQAALFSQRYEGHQINPQQAMALLKQRGWLTSVDQGVQRAFHHAKLMATVEFQQGGYTPLDVEGLTVKTVQFYGRDDWRPLPLVDIPPILFSEVMRDLDLVVSVAHQGGVDPETTASTVEMRANLVRETSRLMKLSNVQLQSAHVLIEGQLGSYSVHLGSGLVHRQPGGALCILPVSAQHRGRLFLPFVDPDPKTAEVISKVLLLAKDHEIKDPTILEQIL
jgi:Family of unknown function (DUF5724)/Domain of unknown function (DUF4132)